MVDNPRYNANPELMAMKQDIADREYKLTLKEMFITGLGVAAGAALAFFVAPAIPILAGGIIMPTLLGGALGFVGGTMFGSMVTMKDHMKLKIDEDMVDGYLKGKNQWGAGYREEVAEHGYSLAGPSALPPQVKTPDRGR